MEVNQPINGTAMNFIQVTGVIRTDYAHPVGATFYNTSTTYAWHIDVAGNKRSYIAGTRVGLSLKYVSLGAGDSIAIYDGKIYFK